MAVIPKPYTITDPRTMMIHSQYAFPAMLAMMCTRWFVSIAFFAETRSSDPNFDDCILVWIQDGKRWFLLSLFVSQFALYPPKSNHITHPSGVCPGSVVHAK